MERRGFMRAMVVAALGAIGIRPAATYSAPYRGNMIDTTGPMIVPVKAEWGKPRIRRYSTVISQREFHEWCMKKPGDMVFQEWFGDCDRLYFPEDGTCRFEFDNMDDSPMLKANCAWYAEGPVNGVMWYHGVNPRMRPVTPGVKVCFEETLIPLVE